MPAIFRMHILSLCVNANCMLINNKQYDLLLGEISYAQLLITMPFGGEIVAVTVSGKTLKDAFENSIRSYDNSALTGRFLQMSGR